ncbi:hypothetical protein LZL87_007466 [Fusarium oxysporum]|nr:hypothetical protein LZL87_007466 [Fusarium oxysporum]
MGILKLPVEIVSLLVELLNVEDVFNLALSCKSLTYILYDRRMCRLALLKAPYSAEAQEAQSTKDFPSNHLRVLSTLDKKSTSERIVDVPLLLKLAVRDYDPQRPHTFEPLYYAEGVLSCLATQVLEDSTTSSWLVIFELRESPTWVVVQRPCSRHPLFVRNDKNYLFWGSKSHARLDGSYRWGIHCLNLQTRKWADSQLILWDLDGESIGSGVCFEIIDGQFYCVSNTFRTEADDGMRNNFYQVVRFPVDNAVHDKCERPPMRNLWRLHDSEGAVDERWTSLQLTKDEKTGNLFIVETRKEWFPGNAGSQRTCYKKELHFDKQEEAPQPEPSLPTPPESTVDSLDEDEWSSENHIEERSNEKIHIGDGPSDAKAYTLQECFVRSYNPSCDAFIDLVSEAYSPDSMLQLRVQPKKREPSVNIWPRDQDICHYDSDLAQLQGVVNPIQPIQGIEWSMDERILVYSPTHMAYGQLRPIILISFDPEYVLQGFPNYAAQTQGANGHLDTSPRSEISSGQKGILWSSNQDFDESASPGKDDPNTAANFVRSRPSLYRTMSMGNGNAHGFDLSYPCPWR